MNEVKKCSLAGLSFTFDKEAYTVLNDYIESLKKAYHSTEDGQEIVADIEARIVELILSTQDSEQVVQLPLVRNIIEQLGSAEDITQEEEEEDKDLKDASPEIPRRLYRDMSSAKLGGVCSGLGKYFTVDPVWIRLALCVPIVLYLFFHTFWMMSNIIGIEIVCYMIMWFTVPAARTARQRLEMEGLPITASSVAQQTSQSSDADSQAKPIIANTVSLFGRIVLVLMKIFAGFVVLGLIIATCVVIIAMAAFLITDATWSLQPQWFDEVSMWLPILWGLVILLPLMAIIYTLMSLIANNKPRQRTLFIMLILWILSLIMSAVVTLKDFATIEQHTDLNIFSDHVYEWTRDTQKPKDLKMDDLSRQLEKMKEKITQSKEIHMEMEIPQNKATQPSKKVSKTVKPTNTDAKELI